MTESSIDQLLFELQTQTEYLQKQNLYQTYLDGTTASGFLCGYAGEVTTVANAPFSPYYGDGTPGTNSPLGPGVPNQALSTFGLMFMLPLNPNSGFSIPPMVLDVNDAQPLSTSSSLTFSTTFNDIGCNQPGALAGSETVTVQWGTTWSMTASQQKTYGYALNNQWNVGASLLLGNNFDGGAQATASVTYTSSTATNQQSTSAYSVTNSGSSTTSASLSIPITCPVGPKYTRTIPCIIRVSHEDMHR